MKKDVNRDFKIKQIELLIQTSEYIELLKEVSSNISIEAKNAENEATIVSIFEIELF